MKEFKSLGTTAQDRVDWAVNMAYELVSNDFANGNFDEEDKEVNVQIKLISHLEKLLPIVTYDDAEIFKVNYEKNFMLNDRKDRVDIVVKYIYGPITYIWPIEVKYKKKSQGAYDCGNIYTHEDIKDIEEHLTKTENVAGGYVIFFTDDVAYTKQSTTGARMELPMYDGCVIEEAVNYELTGEAARKAAGKYVAGYNYNHTFKIEYTHIESVKKDHWCFMIRF